MKPKKVDAKPEVKNTTVAQKATEVKNATVAQKATEVKNTAATKKVNESAAAEKHVSGATKNVTNTTVKETVVETFVNA